LEHSVGVRLLERSPRGIQPTQYGRVLIKRGVAAFDEFRQGVKDIEDRAPNQLLLCDFQHRTRSWLMVASIESGDAGTRLYFGSAVVPVRRRSGEAALGFTFSALLGFHKLCSRILLRAARSRLAGRRRAGGDNERPLPALGRRPECLLSR
jgi:DNA-binding transcriptional LysR family regulator